MMVKLKQNIIIVVVKPAPVGGLASISTLALHPDGRKSKLKG
jgi:hypothetical protein